jgi:hypothetical protein
MFSKARIVKHHLLLAVVGITAVSLLVADGSHKSTANDSAHSHGNAGAPDDNPVTKHKAPIKTILHCPLAFAGVHLRKDEPSDAINAFHYCVTLNDDLTQCVLYDGKGPNARLIGIEYLVPEEVYLAMPPEEQQYWHNHHHEVDDKLLKCLTMDGQDEEEVMKVVRTLYGKIFHTWWRGDKYPEGSPKLFWAVYGKEPFVMPEGFKLPPIVAKRRDAAKVASE